MVFRTMSAVKYSLQCFVLPVLLVTSWDIAVVTKDEINFIQKGRLIGAIGGRLKEMSAAAYDPVHGFLYVSDTNQVNASIFRVNIFHKFEDTSAVAFKPVVTKQKEDVTGMTYDPVTNSLFWTISKTQSIHTLTLNHSQTVLTPSSGRVLHQFRSQSPVGIAVDSCRQTLYWTNTRHPHATIGRSRTDGTELDEFVKTGLNQPYGIEVDSKSKKVYWCDTDLSFSYHIESIRLDGSNRTLLMDGQDQQPFAISIGSDKIYWTDLKNTKVLSLPKTSNEGIEPEMMMKMKDGLRGIVSNQIYSGVDTKECASLAPFMQKITQNHQKDPSILSNLQPSTILTDDAKPETVCLHNGTLVDGVCVCPKSFSGVYCENSLCQNYCFNGTCEVGPTNDTPTCKCEKGWSGIRCETDRCRGVCSNGGKCAINEHDETVCSCPSGYHGTRCEFQSSMLEELCRPYCLRDRHLINLRYQSSSQNEPAESQLCRCSEIIASVTDEYGVTDDGNGEAEQQPLVTQFGARINIAIVSTLAVLCLVLGVVVALLATKISALKKRPRIRKRIVVNKPAAPFAFRPQSPREQCEITIENCCNMNICETPCFEPDYKSSRATFNKRKSEDKRNLIGSMHSNSSQEEENY